MKDDKSLLDLIHWEGILYRKEISLQSAHSTRFFSVFNRMEIVSINQWTLNNEMTKGKEEIPSRRKTKMDNLSSSIFSNSMQNKVKEMPWPNQSPSFLRSLFSGNEKKIFFEELLNVSSHKRSNRSTRRNLLIRAKNNMTTMIVDLRKRRHFFQWRLSDQSPRMFRDQSNGWSGIEMQCYLATVQTHLHFYRFDRCRVSIDIQPYTVHHLENGLLTHNWNNFTCAWNWDPISDEIWFDSRWKLPWNCLLYACLQLTRIWPFSSNWGFLQMASNPAASSISALGHCSICRRTLFWALVFKNPTESHILWLCLAIYSRTWSRLTPNLGEMQKTSFALLMRRRLGRNSNVISPTGPCIHNR